MTKHRTRIVPLMCVLCMLIALCMPVQAFADSETVLTVNTRCNDVPVQYIQDNPDRANAYISEENHVVNIDLGCACMEGRYFSREENALCCMNLDRYAAGAGKDAYIYIRKEKQ